MYRILLVEDDPGIVQPSARICGSGSWTHGACRISAPSWRNSQPLTRSSCCWDISLPFFNGYHWCTQIRAVSRVPVVFLSSASENMNIVMAMNMGADDSSPSPSIWTC